MTEETSKPRARGEGEQKIKICPFKMGKCTGNVPLSPHRILLGDNELFYWCLLCLLGDIVIKIGGV